MKAVLRASDGTVTGASGGRRTRRRGEPLLLGELLGLVVAAHDVPVVLADQICAAYDGNGVCRVVYIISAGEYVNAFPGATVRATGSPAARAAKVTSRGPPRP